MPRQKLLPPHNSPTPSKAHCPACKEAGKESFSAPGNQTTTLMPMREHFFDQHGFLHHHDPNRISTLWICSERHRYVEVSFNLCPAPGCDTRSTRLEILK